MLGVVHMASNETRSAPKPPEFLVPAGTYLLGHAMGALPVKTLAVKDKYFSAWAEHGNNAWEIWASGIEHFKAGLAKLLGGQASEFCPQTNVSSGLSKIVSSLPRRPNRTRILFSEGDFPTVGHILSQSPRLGFEPVCLPSPNAPEFMPTLMSSLDERVSLLFLSHVFFGNSRLVDPAPLIRHAQQFGITTVVDVAQSAGVVPINVAQWDADFVVGVGHKWLCGGHGSSFLWANAKTMAKHEPIDVGWFSHQTPMDFDIHRFQYADDARRFWGGTPSVLPYLIAAESIHLLSDYGVDVIRRHNLELTSDILGMADEAGLKVVTPKANDMRGGTVTIAFAQPEKMLALFKQHNIHVDFRPNYGIRFSPHIYNGRDDIISLTRLI
jgi:kynureninase